MAARERGLVGGDAGPEGCGSRSGGRSASSVKKSRSLRRMSSSAGGRSRAAVLRKSGYSVSKRVGRQGRGSACGSVEAGGGAVEP